MTLDHPPKNQKTSDQRGRRISSSRHNLKFHTYPIRVTIPGDLVEEGDGNEETREGDGNKFKTEKNKILRYN